MDDLIKRYIAETIHHLSVGERADVQQELEANILDMVGESPDVETIEETLLALGSPASLASQYRGRPHHLIGPDTFPLYWKVLCIVLLIAAPLAALFSIIGFIITPPTIALAEMVARTFAAAGGAVVLVFFWVTIAFALVDAQQIPVAAEVWDRATLRALEEKAGKAIKTSSVIGDLVALAIGLLALTFLMTNSDLLALYSKEHAPIPLFIAVRLRPYLIAAMVVAFLSFLVAIIKLIRRRWSASILVISSGVTIITTASWVFFLTRWNLYTPDLLASLALTQPRWQFTIRSLCGFCILMGAITIGTECYHALWKERV